MITVIKDVDLIDHVDEYDAILVGANIYAHMNGGFQFDIKRLYPYVHEANINTRYGDRKRLGTVLEAKSEGKPTFCLCYILEQINTRPDLKKDNLDYESLDKCLKLVNVLYRDKRIASTLLGNSRFDGNGDREKILNLFEKNMSNVDIDIYDFNQETIYSKWRKAYSMGVELKKRDKNAWKEYIKESKKRLTRENNS